MTTTIATRLDALSHRPQRKLLVRLFHRNPQDDTLDDGDNPEVEDEELEILCDFRHFHLPELESKGFIDYDREDHIITKGRKFEEIEPLIELIDRHQDELPDDWF